MNQINTYNAPPETLPTPPSRRLARLPQALSIGLDSVESGEREQLEACIAARFDQQYQAHISHFLPYLLSLSESNELGAVVGMRLAASRLAVQPRSREQHHQAVVAAAAASAR